MQEQYVGHSVSFIIELIPKLKVAYMNPIFRMNNRASDHENSLKILSEEELNDFWDELINKQHKAFQQNS
jgi:hypothetical protein